MVWTHRFAKIALYDGKRRSTPQTLVDAVGSRPDAARPCQETAKPNTQAHSLGTIKKISCTRNTVFGFAAWVCRYTSARRAPTLLVSNASIAESIRYDVSTFS
eukprot:3784846-Rhodomonas_salina.1